MLKLKLPSIIFILFLFILYQFIISPTISDLTDCMDSAIVQMEEISKSAEAENWGKERICSKGKESLESINLCIQEVKKQKILASFLLQLSGVKGKSKSIVDKHNQVCTRYPVAPIF